jgi:hypothetical protein
VVVEVLGLALVVVLPQTNPALDSQAVQQFADPR